MAEFVTLERFGATERNYHIYRLCSSAMDHQDHYHNYFQVCYVVSGELIHCQKGTSVTLGAGDAFIVPPGFTHSLHFNADSTEMYSLAFDESLFQPGFPQSNAFQFLASLQADSTGGTRHMVRLRVMLDANRRRLMESLLDSLLRQQQSECAPGLSAAPSITAAVVYLLAQSYYRQPQNADKLEKLDNYNGTMLHCVEYIDQHYTEHLQLSELAKKFGLSQSAFCSVFPQFAGMPLRKYIAHKRIKQAQVLIRAHPEWSLNRIAGEVGYDDDSTFYRNFLRVAGVSPSGYRAMWGVYE